MSDFRVSSSPSYSGYFGGSPSVCRTEATSTPATPEVKPAEPVSKPETKPESSSSVSNPPDEDATYSAVETGEVNPDFAEGCRTAMNEELGYMSLECVAAEGVYQDGNKTTRAQAGVVRGQITDGGGSGSVTALVVESRRKFADGSSDLTRVKAGDAQFMAGISKGEDGSIRAGAGASATLVSLELGYDSGTGNSITAGVSVGVGASLYIETKDSDKDGLQESCIGGEGKLGIGVTGEICIEETESQGEIRQKMEATDDLGERSELALAYVFAPLTDAVTGRSEQIRREKTTAFINETVEFSQQVMRDVEQAMGQP